ncbi:Bug family tripartite tricarboxylate transporter substrate binding protein [Belnapia rosea]|uniref:Tripartite-type tricarboxylate transporter, receptor component TctC n=1 Tax=Belnapia rosea TaxID=938405 RepID=A0A1G6Y221_9PROT|nr:tripartite tricarboxylate transporter substrate binding protein [Belnapia rosea]SDD84331.1 Tripartite-type tricarboxylate transporter, receptor component TctC [Belnapia rosea]
MTSLNRRLLLRAGALSVAAMPASRRAVAQEGWRPSQTVRIVVPGAPGGTTDLMARFLASHLQSRWGQNIVVDNRSGGGGTVGTLEVVRSRPDGHTILLGNIGPQAIAYSLIRGMQYQPGDLIPISGMLRGPNVLVVNPAVPVRSVPEFVAYLRKNPDRLSYGTSGLGQSVHISGVLFHQLIGLPGTAAHFRGSSPAQVSLIANDVQYMFDNLPTMVEHIRSGKVRALAVTSADRNSQLAELPALRETMPELAGYDVNTWFGAFLPAGTPAAVVQSLNAEMKVLLDGPETRTRFAALGGVPDYRPPAEYGAFVQAEIEKWGTVLKKEGLQVEAD